MCLELNQFNSACSEASLSQKTWRHSWDARQVVARFAIVKFCFLPTCLPKTRFLRNSKYTAKLSVGQSKALHCFRKGRIRPSEKICRFRRFSFDCRPITSCRTASRFCASLKWTPEPNDDPWWSETYPNMWECPYWHILTTSRLLKEESASLEPGVVSSNILEHVGLEHMIWQIVRPLAAPARDNLCNGSIIKEDAKAIYGVPILEIHNQLGKTMFAKPNSTLISHQNVCTLVLCRIVALSQCVKLAMPPIRAAWLSRRRWQIRAQSGTLLTV